MSTQDIQEELERTRSEMDSTLDELEQRLSPSTLMENVMDSVRSGVVADYAKLTVERVKANPLAAALVGFGIGWLVVSPTREGIAETAHASALRERAERIKDRMRPHTEHYGAEAQGRFAQYTESARTGTRRMQSSIGAMVDDHPLATGVMALAVGAAIGALLPTSRREDEWLGESREDLMARARELGEEGVERAKRVAGHAAEAAKEQAQREGLSREGAREEWRSVKEKVEHVAEAAKDAAAEEAKRGGD